MINWQPIAKAVGAALVLMWAVYTEFRLRQVQGQNEVLKRQVSDDAIEKSNSALDHDQLASKLESELGPIARKS